VTTPGVGLEGHGKHPGSERGRPSISPGLSAIHLVRAPNSVHRQFSRIDQELRTILNSRRLGYRVLVLSKHLVLSKQGHDRLVDKDLRRLFLIHQNELHAYLTRRLRDRDLASDLAQDIFIRLAERGPQRAVADDRSYLYRTARNLAIDHVRRVNRRRTDVTEHDDLADIPDHLPNAEEVMDTRERLDRLRPVIQELPERTRQVFVLHRIEELTYGEVAARLGISESSVQKHLAKALQYVVQRLRSR
jgi:RNA polymerase sigma factor (sigma-70 family)